jgi:hypothetical protein
MLRGFVCLSNGDSKDPSNLPLDAHGTRNHAGRICCAALAVMTLNSDNGCAADFLSVY